MFLSLLIDLLMIIATCGNAYARILYDKKEEFTNTEIFVLEE